MNILISPLTLELPLLVKLEKIINCLVSAFIFSPEEDEDGFTIRNSVQLLVVVQEGLNTVNQAGRHLVHLIKDEHGAWAVGDITFDPLL